MFSSAADVYVEDVYRYLLFRYGRGMIVIRPLVRRRDSSIIRGGR